MPRSSRGVPGVAQTLTLGLAILLAGCDGTSPTTTDTVPGYERLGPGRDATGGELVGVPRYRSDLQVAGRGTTELTLTLALSAMAGEPDQVVAEMMSPDLDKSHMHTRVRAGGAFAPTALVTPSVTAVSEAPITQAFSLERPAPGLYPIYVRLRPPPGAGSRTSPLGVVVDSTIDTYWLTVDEDGASISRTYEAAKVPKGGQRMLGRRRAAPGVRGITGPSLVTGVDSNAVEGIIGWYDADAGLWKPLSGVVARVVVWDNYENREVYYYQQGVDPDGYFTFGCNAAFETTSLLITFLLQKPGVEFNASGGEELNAIATLNIGPGYCEDGDISAIAERVEVIQNLSFFATSASTFFARSRSAVPVKFDNSQSVSFYTNDFIHIRTDNVWGPWSYFTQGHEYGHSFHEKALSGNTGSGACPSPHYQWTPSNLGCAYSEGFASYLSVALGGAATGQLSSYESNPYTPSDGSKTEGSVTSFLLDLTDPYSPTDPHDGIQVTGPYIADIVRTCMYSNLAIGFLSRANGVDHLIYCMEQQVPSSITSTYFTSRSPRPVREQESATEPAGWSRAAIRTTWLWNLYHIIG